MTDSFDNIRIDLVNAMWKASGCAISLCTAPDCGHIDIERMFGQLGIEHDGKYDGGPRYRFMQSLEPVINNDQLDSLFMLNVLLSDGSLTKDHILEGMMEVPRPVGDLLWEHGWNARLAEAMNASPWIREATNREFVLELTKIAFPDSFLETLPANHTVTEVLTGEVALRDMRERFTEAMLVAPKIPAALIGGLNVWSGDWGWNSGSPWALEACYMLDFAIRDVSGVEAHTWGVQIPFDYVNTPRDDYFMCAHRGHGVNSYGLGIVAQFGGLFISQQTGYGGVYMDSPGQDVTKHMKAYNEFIAPLEKFNSSVNTAVLFSDYRGYAVLFTTERRAFVQPQRNNESEPSMWQFPNGWGIAAELNGPRDKTFLPRLKEIVEANYSPQLTASAQYLLEVVRIFD